MRFKIIAFTLIVSSVVFILGCDDEDSSTVGGGGRISFQVTLNPPLDSAYLGLLATGLNSEIHEETLTANSILTTVTGFTTDELTVTKGEPVSIRLVVNCLHPNNWCSSVQMKALLNGSEFDVQTYNMGGTAINSCPDGSIKVTTVFIP